MLVIYAKHEIQFNCICLAVNNNVLKCIFSVGEWASSEQSLIWHDIKYAYLLHNFDKICTIKRDLWRSKLAACK